MIDGVTVRDLVVREDERGWLTEMLSVNMDDKDLCHIYAAMARPGVAKAFHCHLRQTDRFVCIEGTAKVGMVDLRGPLFGPSVTTDNITQRDSLCRMPYWTYLGAEGADKNFLRWMKSAAKYAESVDDCWATQFPSSNTFRQHQTVVLSSERPQLLTIPRGVAHGQYALGNVRSVILNAPTEPFDREHPDELRMPADNFDYKWGVESK